MVILEAPSFDGHQDPGIFNEWLYEIDEFIEHIGLSYVRRARFAKMKLISRARDYWQDVEDLCIRKGKPPITDWEQMKEIIIERYIPPSYEQRRERYVSPSYEQRREKYVPPSYEKKEGEICSPTLSTKETNTR